MGFEILSKSSRGGEKDEGKEFHVSLERPIRPKIAQGTTTSIQQNAERTGPEDNCVFAKWPRRGQMIGPQKPSTYNDHHGFVLREDLRNHPPRRDQ